MSARREVSLDSALAGKRLRSAVNRLKMTRNLSLGDEGKGRWPTLKPGDDTSKRRNKGRILVSAGMYEDVIKCEKLERDHESMVRQFKLRVTASAHHGDGSWITKVISSRRIIAKLARFPGSRWSHAGRVALLLTTLAEEQDLLASSDSSDNDRSLREEVILAFLRKHASRLVRNVDDHRDVATELLGLRTYCQELLKTKAGGLSSIGGDHSLFPATNLQELIHQLTQLDQAEVRENSAVSKCLTENKYRSEARSEAARDKIGWILHPDGDAVRYWRRLLVAVVVGQCVVVPHNLSFRSSRTTAAFDLATDVVFVLDAVVQLHTAYTSRPHAHDNAIPAVVSSRKRIALNYLRRWLLVDVVALYPLAASLRGLVRRRAWHLTLGATKACRLVKGLKAFRVFQTDETTALAGERVVFNYSRYSNAVHLCLVWLLLIGTMHFLACGWHAVTGRDHWTQRYAEYRRETTYESIPMSWLYTMALYESVLILMGEELSLLRDEELIFAIVSILLCSVLLAIVFGQVGLLISTMNEQPRAFNHKMTALHQAMSQSGLPGMLQERIWAYYAYLWKERREVDGRVRIASFLHELPPNLATEVRLFWCRDMIHSVPFFRLYSFQVIQRLVRAVEVELYMPDDYIVLFGQVGHEMFFIKTGTVDVYRVDVAEVNVVAGTKPRPEIDDAPEPGASSIARRITGGRRTSRASDEAPRNDDCVAADVEACDEPRPSTTPRDDDKTLPYTRRTSLKIPPIPPEQKKKIEREHLVRSLRSGEYFGDTALFTRCRRTATVKARTFVTCSIVKRKDLETVLRDHPEAYHKSKEMLRTKYGTQLKSKRGRLLERAFQEAPATPTETSDEAIVRRLGVLESRLRSLDTAISTSRAPQKYSSANP